MAAGSGSTANVQTPMATVIQGPPAMQWPGTRVFSPHPGRTGCMHEASGEARREALREAPRKSAAEERSIEIRFDEEMVVEQANRSHIVARQVSIGADRSWLDRSDSVGLSNDQSLPPRRALVPLSSDKG